MKIILNQDIVRLGEEGDIREVATGYARNYLIPKGLAVPYTQQNLLTLKSRKKQIEKRKEDKRQEAMGVKERLEEQELRFVMPAGESGKLFGSVNATLIGDELAKLGFEIERKRIEVPDNHIRMVGDHSVRIRLYGKEEASVKVVVEAQS
jgi:large subunit ribosomal protein L9